MVATGRVDFRSGLLLRGGPGESKGQGKGSATYQLTKVKPRDLGLGVGSGRQEVMRLRTRLPDRHQELTQVLRGEGGSNVPSLWETFKQQ